MKLNKFRKIVLDLEENSKLKRKANTKVYPLFGVIPTVDCLTLGKIYKRHCVMKQ